MNSRPRLTLVNSAASEDDAGWLPDGVVEVSDKRERELYDCLVAILQSRHIDANLSWDMLRTEDQSLFLEVIDLEEGQAYYRIQPWLPESGDRAWQMVACYRSDMRMFHSHSMASLALLAIQHFGSSPHG